MLDASVKFATTQNKMKKIGLLKLFRFATSRCSLSKSKYLCTFYVEISVYASLSPLSLYICLCMYVCLSSSPFVIPCAFNSKSMLHIHVTHFKTNCVKNELTTFFFTLLSIHGIFFSNHILSDGCLEVRFSLIENIHY